MPLLRRLFSPIKIGQVKLKNRIVMLGMGVSMCGDEVSKTLLDYYVERAKGGAGLIVVPASPSRNAAKGVLPGIFDDSFVPGLKKLTDGIHQHGSKAAAELVLEWYWAGGSDGAVAVRGPSEMMVKPVNRPALPMTVEEIHRFVEEYGQAGCRAREAGFDVVEIHAGMGFLLSRFLSSASNKRTDQYGGSLQNRMRLLLDIVAKIKSLAGPDFPIGVRISGDEFMPGGHTLAESREVAKTLETNGVAFLDVQAGWEECPVSLTHMSVPRGSFVYQAEEIKKAVSIPVICAYRINDPILAEEILAEGRSDLIGMGRALLADPYLPMKARQGRFDEVRPCIACNHCLDLAFVHIQGGEGHPIECSVNARLGRESETDLALTSNPKKVFVIGAGPAGMEAARVAALRGHRVTLWERAVRMGGGLNTAAKPPGKTELNYLVTNMGREVKKAGVQIRLNAKLDPADIVAATPDAVVVATGAKSIIPRIPGVNRPNVVLAKDVLCSRSHAGESVVVIGGGLVGCETADFLVEQGKKVTVLEMLPRMGADIGLTVRWGILGALKRAGVRLEAGTMVTEITEAGVKAKHADGSEEYFQADTVILAVGVRPDVSLADTLKGSVPEVYLAGDCVRPGRIKSAIREGYDVGMRI